MSTKAPSAESVRVCHRNLRYDLGEPDRVSNIGYICDIYSCLKRRAVGNEWSANVYYCVGVETKRYAARTGRNAMNANRRKAL
jgi:hypothetical protein